MTKGADIPRDTLLRHWRMLREIPRHPRKISTSELVKRLESAEFEITQRSVQRDLNKLSRVLPLMADEGKPQGWSWQADVPQLDLPALEPQAALMFHLVERYLRPLLPATTVDYLGPWFRAADHVLDATGNGLSAWRSKVRILPPGQPLHPPTMEPTIQGTVTQALFQGKRLSVIYRPRGDRGSKEYVVNPLGLVVRDHVMYLVCTLFEYNNPMQLVLHRLRSAEMLEEPANLLPGFDLDQYIAEGGFGFPVEARKKIKLVAEFTRDAALTFIERPLDLKQVVEDIDAETVRLTATVMDTYELRTWLLGFGKHVLVREPASLVSNL